MKLWLKVLTIIVLVVVVLLAALFIYVRYFMFIPDKGGMEKDGGEPEVMDGDYTYVDNEALLSKIAGTWVSSDGSYTLVLDKEYRAALSLNSETVLDCKFSFTYLQPGTVTHTEFTLDTWELRKGSEPAYAEIEFFYHELSNVGDSRIVIVGNISGDGLNIEFVKES